VIHRDVKPNNVLLDEAGNAYLSDFGLAKMIEMSLDLTRSGNLVGTPAYVAPELVRGEPASTKADIYSLGVILYHMLAGRPPFEQSEAGVLACYKHARQSPPLRRSTRHPTGCRSCHAGVTEKSGGSLYAAGDGHGFITPLLVANQHDYPGSPPILPTTRHPPGGGVTAALDVAVLAMLINGGLR
jgi:serine/threonine protein kinase